MMSKLRLALDLAVSGYHVFPLESDSKTPRIDGFPTKATRDPAQINAWWVDPIMGWEQDFNIGISTSNYGDAGALLVVDVDKKGDKDGDRALLELELEGFTLPDTAVATTPTGGRHHIYRVERALCQSVGKLGDGLDTRSSGGYIVAAGSTIGSGAYAWNTSERTPREVPDWLRERFRVGAPAVSGATRRGAEATISASSGTAIDRAVRYLKSLPAVTAGERNHAGYRTAAMLKDYGIAVDDCAALMLEHWPCEPMLDIPEIEHVVKSAYTYGTEPPGSLAPENQFDPIPAAAVTDTDSMEAAFAEINKEFAFVLEGGSSHIIWETTDASGRPQLKHLNLASFHQKFASWQLPVGRRREPVTELWMKSKTRRSYDGLCFRPGLETEPRFYNLWQGFTVEPLSAAELVDSKASEAQESVAMFLEHIRENVCNGNAELSEWLIGFFAHMIQRPWEKPQVALVFRGGKGVGKSAIVARMGHLLGSHFLSTAKLRFVVDHFNGHLENNLFLVLEEALWSGDKQSEGILKDLITGDEHVIERKGKETFKVDNRSRIAIIGNEDWLVPASHDERRYAVFDVGDSRKQDTRFFIKMRVGMEHGGYRALLSHLLQVPLGGLDFNAAPSTQGLLDQKEESLDPVHAWWSECLTEGRIVGADFEETWPSEADATRFRQAYQRYASERNIRSWRPNTSRIGRLLKKCVPDWGGRQRARVKESMHSVYRLPPLDDCRAAWSKFIGHDIQWSY